MKNFIFTLFFISIISFNAIAGGLPESFEQYLLSLPIIKEGLCDIQEKTYYCEMRESTKITYILVYNEEGKFIELYRKIEGNNYFDLIWDESVDLKEIHG